MRKTIAVLFVLLLGTMFLAGCWNSRELRNLAIVVGIGIDKIPNSEQYRVSFQIVNPHGASEGKARGSSSGEAPHIVYTSVDYSIFSALRKTTQKVPRQLFFAHAQLLVIGEALAKEGIQELFDFYERSHELRLNTSVAIARGTSAESVLKVLTPLTTSDATAISSRLKITSEIWAHNVDQDISSIIKQLAGGGEPAISGVRIVDSNSTPTSNLELKGIALLSKGKLAGWMDGRTARGAVWALNQMKSTNVNLDCGEMKNGISIEVIRSSTKVRAHVVEGKPAFTIKVKEEGSLSEARCSIDPGSKEAMLKLQQQLADETKQEIELAVQAAQAKKSDSFNLWAELKRTQPKLWERIQKEWPDIFAGCEVKVEVEAFIRRTGMRGKTFTQPQD